MMTDNGISLADIAAVTERDGMNNWQNNPFMYLVFLYMFRMFGNDWNNGNSAAVQGALTRSDLYEGLNNQTVVNKLDELDAQIGNHFSTLNTNVLQGFTALDKSVYTGNAGIMAGITENRFAQQQCCCETQRSIDALSAQNYRDTCEIVNAIRTDGEATRALINQNTVQALRDKIEDKDRELQTANFRISQYAQNDILLSALRPTPVPAYITSSPFVSTNSTCGTCGGYSFN